MSIFHDLGHDIPEDDEAGAMYGLPKKAESFEEVQ